MLQEENKQLILQMAEARTQIYSIISPLADQAEAGYTDPEQKIEVAKTLSPMNFSGCFARTNTKGSTPKKVSRH